MMNKIDKTAVISKKAVIGKNVTVGPYSVIEENVHLSDGVKLDPYVHIKGRTYLGEGSLVGAGAVLGGLPQMMGMRQSEGRLYIGRNNIIREYVTIHAAAKAGGATVLGDDNFLMAFSHLAHDCKLADKVVVCNGSLLAGCVEAGEGAFISGNVVVHQFVKIGKLAMIGGLSRVNQDVVPFMMVVGDSRVWGINAVGLRRAGFSRRELKEVKRAYNILYRQGLSQKNALERLKNIDSEKVKQIRLFVLSSKRGVCGPKKSSFREKLFLDYPYFIRSKILTYDYFLRDRAVKLKR